MVSRVSGLIRDLLMAYLFGDHPSVGAFLVAYRFANILRRFFGEGPLQAAFIPQFEGMRQKDSEEAIHFFQKLSLILSIVVTLIILLSEGGFYLFGQSEVVRLTKWMFPTLLFVWAQ